MNEQIKGVIRAILAGAAGYIAGKGVLPLEQANELAAAILGIVTIAWSAFDKKKSAEKLDAAIAAPAGKAE